MRYSKNTKEIKNTALAKAINMCGSQSELARRIGTQQPIIWGWLYKTGIVPSQHLLAIEEATDGKVTAYHLLTAAPDFESRAKIEEKKGEQQ